MLNGLLKQGNHLVTRVKANAVAYAPAPRRKGRKTRGRPKTYGKKIKLKSYLRMSNRRIAEVTNEGTKVAPK
jgi:hypothetical protein